MKKSLILIISLILIFFVPAPERYAFALQNDLTFNYAKVISEGCAFYSDASLKIVKFIIPKSYSVKIVSTGAEYSHVVYMDKSSLCPASEGYVKNVYLEFLDKTPDVIYPNVNLTVVTDDVVFADNKLSTPKAVIQSGSIAAFYGELTISGFDYVYVYVSGYVGYMRKDCFANFDVPIYEEVIEIPSDILQGDTANGNDTTLDTNTKNDDLSISEIIVIAAIVLVGLLLVFFVIKSNGGNNGNNGAFEDD